jgi:hypothetical protein
VGCMSSSVSEMPTMSTPLSIIVAINFITAVWFLKSNSLIKHLLKNITHCIIL